MEAPGQLLKHYSPYLPCYYCSDLEGLSKQKGPFELKDIALMAFDKGNEELKNRVKYCLEVDKFEEKSQGELPKEVEEENIFCSPEEQAAMKNLYFMLRYSQNLECKAIVIYWKREKAGTIWDKIFRATEGKQFAK